MSKSGIYEKKCENCENIDIWGKVRNVLKFWGKLWGVRKRGKSVEIEEKWEMWEKVRHMWEKLRNVWIEVRKVRNVRKSEMYEKKWDKCQRKGDVWGKSERSVRKREKREKK